MDELDADRRAAPLTSLLEDSPLASGGWQLSP
jgi:hypothetical protein